MEFLLMVIVVLALVWLLVSAIAKAASKSKNNELIAFHSELKRASDEEEALAKEVEELLAPLLEITENIICQHRSILGRKLRQLAYVDDYGLEVLDGWKRESKYFLENVVLTDPAIDSLRFQLHRKDPSEDKEHWFHSLYMAKAQELVDYHAKHEWEMRSSESSPSFDSDSCSPAEYEQHCAAILEAVGWSSKVVGGTGDQGVDVTATKDGRTLVAQCKKYMSPVGNSAVQEIFTGKQHYAAHYAAVVSNQSYTPAARQLAATTGVLLLHHDQLQNIDEMLPR